MTYDPKLIDLLAYRAEGDTAADFTVPSEVTIPHALVRQYLHMLAVAYSNGVRKEALKANDPTKITPEAWLSSYEGFIAGHECAEDY